MGGMIPLVLAAALLQPCPDTPNCVSTEATDEHRIDAIPFNGTAEQARRALLRAIGSIPRTRVVYDDGQVVRAEFRTLVFRFVDDAVFVIDSSTATIRFRSASRTGYSDLGVNRRRMERVRRRFTEQ